MSGVKGINAGESNWNYKHGGTGTRLHNIWLSMRERCHRVKHSHYKDYGGRGIIICGEWDDFSVFRAWAELNGYADDLTIDRVDNNGNYDPDNCTWIPMSEQYKNKQSNCNRPLPEPYKGGDE